jgi:hypothetical protein
LIDVEAPCKALKKKPKLVGPCRDRTYDQLIKSGFLARDLLPSKTNTYAPPVVPRFVDLRIDKALSVLLGGFSNGTGVIHYETQFVEPPAG